MDHLQFDRWPTCFTALRLYDWDRWSSYSLPPFPPPSGGCFPQQLYAFAVLRACFLKTLRRAGLFIWGTFIKSSVLLSKS